MSAPTLVWKWIGLLLLGFACGRVAFAIAADPQSTLRRAFKAHIARLDRQLKDMFRAQRGALIARLQLAFALLLLGACLTTADVRWALGLYPVYVVPSYWLRSLQRARVRAIEASLDGLALTLANALRATPSIGNALIFAEPLMAGAVREEVGVVIKEMRLGTTVEQAILNMGRRVGSMELDATLSGLLIGRQVGGDLPRILETNAATLREMARLQGVVRTKTAEGRLQVAALAFAPAVVLIGLDLVQPGYFAPLTENALGWVMIVAIVASWLVALVVSRQVLRVEV